MPDLVGKGFATFWNFKGRYRIIKGGRGSKKSTTASLNFPYKMMEYYHKYKIKPHLLVIRRYYNTHQYSTFSQLKWAINRLGVSHLWKAKLSPLELEYKPSGQKILFRGLDDPESISSITVEDGHLCWVWWEEAFQVTNEQDFNKVDLSIRGEVPEPLYKQHTMTFNPWSEKIWIKKRFFDGLLEKGQERAISADGDILVETKKYTCNEFLDESDLKVFDLMCENNPRRYSIEGLGEWGIAEGLVYTNWQEREFDVARLRNTFNVQQERKYTELYGLDFGYSNDPTAFVALLINEEELEIYIYDEIYKTKMSNKEIYNTIKYKGYANKRIAADSADPRTIAELKDLGLNGIFGQEKPKGSILAGIQKLQDYTIYVHPRCENTIIELNNYVWKKDKADNVLNAPIDDYNHIMDSLRYATFKAGTPTFSW